MCLCACSVVSYSLQPHRLAYQAPLSMGSRILEWIAISFSKGFYQCRERTSVFCISCTGRQILYHQATDWVAFKQQELVLHSSGGWEVKIKETYPSYNPHRASQTGSSFLESEIFSVWWEPASLGLTVSSHERRCKGALWGLLYKGTNPIHNEITFQRPHLQIPSLRGLGFNTWIWEGPIQSLAPPQSLSGAVINIAVALKLSWDASFPVNVAKSPFYFQLLSSLSCLFLSFHHSLFPSIPPHKFSL